MTTDATTHPNADDPAVPPDGAPEWAVHLPPGTAPADADLGQGRNLPETWTAHWASDPARPVVHDRDEGWVTGGELEARTLAVAGRLHGAGLMPGDRIVISAEASIELVVAYVAALRLGLTVLPINSAYREPEVVQVVRDAGPRAVITDQAERGRWIAAALPDVVVTGTDVALPDHAPPAGGLDRAARHDPALLVYTSGTTGLPKGAPLSHANLLAGAHALRIAWRWTPDDRLLLVLPLFHLHGLGAGLNGTLTAGASMVLHPGFEPAAVLDGIGAHGATMFFGVPTMYGRLAGAAGVERLGDLRLCVSGSAPLPPDLFATIRDRTGQAILERYGMTETVLTVSNPHDAQRRPGTVGFPLPGVEARVDADSGELQLRGPSVFAGYWNRPEETAATFTDDGWLRTGDLVDRDEVGYLRIIGRAKDLIISGGYNVYPREVEEALREHVAVADVAVVGLPSREWGEAVTAVVVAAGEPAEAELRDFAKQRLAPYKRPKAYRFVDELPRNALGKVLKHVLREP